MVTPLSDGGGVRGLLLFDVAVLSGLLVVTNFPTDSAALLVDGFAFAALAATGLAWATVLAGAAFAGTCLTATGFAGATLAAFFTALAGAAFFDGRFFAVLLRTVFEVGLVAPLFAGADFAATGFTGFRAAICLALATGLAAALRAAPATAFARAGALAAFARLPEFFLLFAIPKPILVTRRSRVIA